MAYNKVTVATETEVKSDDINQISDNIELCGRGAEADHLYCYGTKQMTIANGGTADEEAVTFATEAENGDPGFGSAPKITFGLERVSGTISGVFCALIKESTLSTSGFTIQLFASATQGDDVVFNVFWHADGQ